MNEWKKKKEEHQILEEDKIYNKYKINKLNLKSEVSNEIETRHYMIKKHTSTSILFSASSH